MVGRVCACTMLETLKALRIIAVVREWMVLVRDMERDLVSSGSKCDAKRFAQGQRALTQRYSERFFGLVLASE